jgi:hypothetical protein
MPAEFLAPAERNNLPREAHISISLRWSLNLFEIGFYKHLVPLGP